MARHYSSWSRNMNLYYKQMAPIGVCFWFCIACHEIWATQNVSPYIVPAYELCSFYAADWVLDQWFTVSLYTATLGGRRAEHIWGLRLLLKPMCRLGWADKGLFLYSLFWLRLINIITSNLLFALPNFRFQFLDLDFMSETCVACACAYNTNTTNGLIILNVFTIC